MMSTFIGTKAECEQVADAINKMCGYPRRGVNIGGGIHVEIPDVYYPGAPGWTAAHAEPVEDEQKGRGFAVDIADFTAVEKFDTGKLDAKELADLDVVGAKLEAAAELPSDWYVNPTTKPAVVEPPKEETKPVEDDVGKVGVLKPK